MQKLFTKYISLVIMIASILLSVVAWNSLGSIARASAKDSLSQKLAQVMEKLNSNEEELKNLTDSLHEDYLRRAYAFAYIIQKTPEVLDSQEELGKIKELLMVDELHVVDEQGFLFAGSIPKYIGMDFRSSKQTAEFLGILDGKMEELVQDIQPNGAEQKIFQYIGVKRQDQKGIVQIGLAPTRLLEAKKKNEIPYVIKSMSLSKGGRIIAIRADGTIIEDTKEDIKQANIKELGLRYEELKAYDHGGFVSLGKKRAYTISGEYEDMLLLVSMEEGQVYADRNHLMVVIILSMLFISGITIIVINQMIKKNIINGIHHLMKDLQRIQEGDLQTVVNVDQNPEFKQISTAINKMVQSILQTTGRVSQIIDLIDMPIGVFEFHKNGTHVLASNRLKYIMMWSEEEAEQYLKDRKLFLAQLDQIMRVSTKEQAYPIAQDKWIRIYLNEDEDSIFGIIYDVSEEMKEKKQIKYERDHDHLTGLNTMHHFQKIIQHILDKYPKAAIKALIMLDLDFFKNVNDRYGHGFGDEYLKTLASVLKQMENEHCICARRSGDEFCIFFYNYQTKEEVRERMAFFYACLLTNTLRYKGEEEQVIHVSSGCCWCEKEADLETWFAHADEALYHSKRGCRGTLSEYKEEEQ